VQGGKLARRGPIGKGTEHTLDLGVVCLGRRPEREGNRDQKSRPSIEESRADDQPMAERMEDGEEDVSTAEEVVRAQAR
jgi:hypothetical protein